MSTSNTYVFFTTNLQGRYYVFHVTYEATPFSRREVTQDSHTSSVAEPGFKIDLTTKPTTIFSSHNNATETQSWTDRASNFQCNYNLEEQIREYTKFREQLWMTHSQMRMTFRIALCLRRILKISTHNRTKTIKLAWFNRILVW